MLQGTVTDLPLKDSKPSPEYETRGLISQIASSDPSILAPALISHFLHRSDINFLAVSGESVVDPGAFLTGANSSCRSTSITNHLVAYGNTNIKVGLI